MPFLETSDAIIHGIRSAVASKKFWVFATDNHNIHVSMTAFAISLRLAGLSEDDMNYMVFPYRMRNTKRRFTMSVLIVPKKQLQEDSVHQFAQNIGHPLTNGNDIIALTTNRELLLLAIDGIVKGKACRFDPSRN